MHFLFAALLWVISLGAAYGVGKSWVESKHAGGWPRLVAWALASLAAIGFTSAYLLLVVAALETFSGDPLVREQVEPLWTSWYSWVIAPLAGFAGTSFFSAWARNYRDDVTNRASYPSYVQLDRRYGEIRSVPQAARAVTADVTGRTRRAILRRQRPAAGSSPDVAFNYIGSAPGPLDLPRVQLPHIEMPKLDLDKIEIGGSGDDDSGKAMLLVLCVVALVIAVCLGVITTWIVIARVAGTAEPLPGAVTAS
jgi:hypothetical protein